MIGKQSKLLAILVFLSLMVVLLIIIVEVPGWGPSFSVYDKKIHRVYSNPGEKQALTAAEKVEYSQYWDLSSILNNDPSSMDQYTGNRFLNKTTIDHYSSIVDRDKADRSQIKEHLDYIGKASSKGHHEIVYNSTKGLKLDGEFVPPSSSVLYSKMFLHAPDRTNPDYNLTFQSSMNLTSFNYSFDDCYLVTMELKYSYDFGSKGAWSFSSFAVVVVDANDNILFVMSNYAPGPHA
jgi:hypothetical protein